MKDDSTDLYGRDYWFGHQTQDLKCPDFITRARTDLAERCVHWLRSLLRFVTPPAKVLEVGCAHGGFVAMLRQAGFDALGLELSPSIVELAHSMFDVPITRATVEDLDIPPGSFDAIVMMDVMEHLPDPVGTIGRCLDLLKVDGVLMVQTPAYPEARSFEQLQASGHQFPRMLDPVEHLMLFSESSAKRLLLEAGAANVVFMPAIFSFYDMQFIATRGRLSEVNDSHRDQALEMSAAGRMIRALLDLDERRQNLLKEYRQLKGAARSDSK